jgi:GT2 family glycosyltransferase/carbonic anhydrase/acetyltransferase-like protein (isoleucine patch superfamily)
MSLFSIIIPSFNRATLLGEALESVFAQRWPDFEVIVVDDGSTDGTMDYLQSLGGRAKVLFQPNQGPGAARNLGARHASGTYLAFLDSDDIWFPWTLETYRDVIHEYAEPSFIVGKPQVFSDRQKLDKIVPGATRTERFDDYLASGDQWRWWGVSSFVIRRDVFAAVGGFTNEWVNGEDADLALRLGDAPSFVQITAPVTFGYREQAESAIKDVKRTFAGAWAQIRAEQAGRYPGGSVRAAERRRILMRHTRPVTLSCLQQGLRRQAWGLYTSTIVWNASLGRIRYLAAFPYLAVAKELRRAKGYRLPISASAFRDDIINRIIRYPAAIAIRLRIARLRLLGVRIGRKCSIRRIHVPRNPWDIVISEGAALDDYVVLLTTGPRGAAPRLVIGGGTYVNRFTMFDASESIEVGTNCLIGPFCYITDHDHGVEPDTLIAEQPLVGRAVRIGSNVWIGAGAIILKGVTVGNGAVIGAGAVVTRDVGSGEKVAGVPARTIGPSGAISVK